MRIPSFSAAKLVSAISLLVLVTSLAVSPASATHTSAQQCAEIMPVADLQKGMIMTGYTVVEGTEPTTFSAEVLGVLQDAIGPGRDMIVVETGGEAIERVGGIWFGISGSPVYWDNKLVGAVAFGLSFGPSKVAGVTPAEDMADILGYPRSEDAEQMAEQSFARSRVRTTAAMRTRIARATGTSEDEVGDFRRLKTPISVSGLSDHAFTRLKRVIKREGMPFVVTPGASAQAAPSPDAPPEPIVPGGNFAAALSYGDITFAGVGTTTYVCNGVALAFGHPFALLGATTVGASNADALTIVDDPVFSGYKLANIGPAQGIVDQDRFAGIRGLLGETPPLIPITSSVTALNLNRSRDGLTQSLTSEFTPGLAFFHMLTNIDFTFDQISEGSSELTWTVTGTRADGSTWTLTRSNRYASDFDISIESLFELDIQLFTLLFNDFEEIEFSGVDVDATVEEDVRAYNITNVLVSKDGVEYQDVRRIRARRGKTIFLRVELTPRDESEVKVVHLEVQIPEDAKSDGFIEVTSGAGSIEDLFCFFEGQECVDETGQKIDTFDKLLTYLENRPKNNELLARLRMGGRGRVKSRDSEVLDQVVLGYESIFVRLVNGGEGGVVVEGKPKG